MKKLIILAIILLSTQVIAGVGTGGVGVNAVEEGGVGVKGVGTGGVGVNAVGEGSGSGDAVGSGNNGITNIGNGYVRICSQKACYITKG